MKAAGGAESLPKLYEGPEVPEDRQGGVHRAPKAIHSAEKVKRVLKRGAGQGRQLGYGSRARKPNLEGRQGSGQIQQHLVEGELADLMHGDEAVLILGGGDRRLAS